MIVKIYYNISIASQDICKSIKKKIKREIFCRIKLR